MMKIIFHNTNKQSEDIISLVLTVCHLPLFFLRVWSAIKNNQENPEVKNNLKAVIYIERLMPDKATT